jgi:hypothetical protein
MVGACSTKRNMRNANNTLVGKLKREGTIQET